MNKTGEENGSENKDSQNCSLGCKRPLDRRVSHSGCDEAAGESRGHVRALGLPRLVFICVGAVEVISAALLLILKAASLGAAALVVVVMAGAIFTHIWSNEWNHVPGVVVLLLLAAIIAYARREQLLGASSGACERSEATAMSATGDREFERQTWHRPVAYQHG